MVFRRIGGNPDLRIGPRVRSPGRIMLDCVYAAGPLPMVETDAHPRPNSRDAKIAGALRSRPRTRHVSGQRFGWGGGIHLGSLPLRSAFYFPQTPQTGWIANMASH